MKNKGIAITKPLQGYITLKMPLPHQFCHFRGIRMKTEFINVQLNR